MTIKAFYTLVFVIPGDAESLSSLWVQLWQDNQIETGWEHPPRTDLAGRQGQRCHGGQLLHYDMLNLIAVQFYIATMQAKPVSITINIEGSLRT